MILRKGKSKSEKPTEPRHEDLEFHELKEITRSVWEGKLQSKKNRENKINLEVAELEKEIFTLQAMLKNNPSPTSLDMTKHIEKKLKKISPNLFLFDHELAIIKIESSNLEDELEKLDSMTREDLIKKGAK